VPVIHFLLDEDVPEAVAQFLRERGHDVEWGRALLPLGSPDHLVVREADRLGAIVVTWNRKHYHPIIRRQPPGVLLRFPRAGLLSFKCSRPNAVQRLAVLISRIEREYVERQEEDDKRVIFEIWEDKYSIHG
jgi:hypothetical protein